MTDERNNKERRATDSWIARITAVAAILSMIYAVAAWGIPLAGLPKRVDVLESHDTPLLYMTCLLFQDSHPRQVPQVCDQAIQQGGR